MVIMVNNQCFSSENQLKTMLVNTIRFLIETNIFFEIVEVTKLKHLCILAHIQLVSKHPLWAEWFENFIFNICVCTLNIQGILSAQQDNNKCCFLVFWS